MKPPVQAEKIVLVTSEAVRVPFGKMTNIDFNEYNASKHALAEKILTKALSPRKSIISSYTLSAASYDVNRASSSSIT